MKVGDYVRTKNGEIGKLVNVEVYYVLGQNDKDKYSCVLFNNSYVPCIVSNDFIVKKGQLIDLIEVGDYVNGKQVEWVGYDLYKEHDNGELEGIGEKRVLFNSFTKDSVRKSGIKSIVTKEQFEEMKYEIK